MTPGANKNKPDLHRPTRRSWRKISNDGEARGPLEACRSFEMKFAGRRTRTFLTAAAAGGGRHGLPAAAALFPADPALTAHKEKSSEGPKEPRKKCMSSRNVCRQFVGRSRRKQEPSRPWKFGICGAFFDSSKMARHADQGNRPS
jgi:hypothetical protein